MIARRRRAKIWKGQANDREMIAPKARILKENSENDRPECMKFAKPKFIKFIVPLVIFIDSSPRSFHLALFVYKLYVSISVRKQNMIVK